jgi:hypothetical protein
MSSYLFDILSHLYHGREYLFHNDKPMQRSLRYLRDHGYLEHFNISDLAEGTNLAGRLSLTPVGNFLVEVREAFMPSNPCKRPSDSLNYDPSLHHAGDAATPSPPARAVVPTFSCPSPASWCHRKTYVTRLRGSALYSAMAVVWAIDYADHDEVDRTPLHSPG